MAGNPPIVWKKLAANILICQAAGALGSLATYQNITGWYAGLAKPSFTPPNWVFGPVWTLLYLLMGIAIYLIWTGRPTRMKKSSAYIAFGLQLALNTAWSVLFFGLKSPALGLVGIGFLWLAIGWTILEFSKHSGKAAALMVPYWAWVSFAALLNFGVWQLNPG